MLSKIRDLRKTVSSYAHFLLSPPDYKSQNHVFNPLCPLLSVIPATSEHRADASHAKDVSLKTSHN